MSTKLGQMTQSASGLTVDIYEGWSWPVFFCGPLWYVVKGMWGVGLLWLAIAVVSAGAGWVLGLFVMPFVANRQYREWLGSHGYAVRSTVPIAVTMSSSATA